MILGAMKRLVVFAAVGCGLLAGCRAKPVAAQPTPSPSPKGTKVLQGVELTPYAGAPVQKDVEAIIDANAKHNQDVQGLADPKD